MRKPSYWADPLQMGGVRKSDSAPCYAGCVEAWANMGCYRPVLSLLQASWCAWMLSVVWRRGRASHWCNGSRKEVALRAGMAGLLWHEVLLQSWCFDPPLDHILGSLMFSFYFVLSCILVRRVHAIAWSALICIILVMSIVVWLIHAFAMVWSLDIEIFIERCFAFSRPPSCLCFLIFESSGSLRAQPSDSIHHLDLITHPTLRVWIFVP